MNSLYIVASDTQMLLPIMQDMAWSSQNLQTNYNNVNYNRTLTCEQQKHVVSQLDS
jgi:hypothetical protein